MTSGDSNSASTSALAIAEAHFPDEARTVQELFNMHDTFRSMCEDLAAAEEALARVDSLPERVREDRRQEYASLVEALVCEIAEALSQSKVVALRPTGETKPKPL